MSGKVGEHNYDLGRFLQRGLHEIANSLFPESNIVLRDHSGLYGGREGRNVEPSQPVQEHERPQPAIDEPELER